MAADFIQPDQRAPVGYLYWSWKLDHGYSGSYHKPYCLILLLLEADPRHPLHLTGIDYYFISPRSTSEACD